jgi:small basic protein (TIGR04137 family)
MSMDRSLKIKSALTRHRNVLSRGERLEKLVDEDRWVEGDNVTGLPKVGNRKMVAAKKPKKEATEDE